MLQGYQNVKTEFGKNKGKNLETRTYSNMLFEQTCGERDREKTCMDHSLRLLQDQIKNQLYVTIPFVLTLANMTKSTDQ